MMDARHRLAGALLVLVALTAVQAGVAAAQEEPVKPVLPVKPLDPLKPVYPIAPREPRAIVGQAVELQFVNALTADRYLSAKLRLMRGELILADGLRGGRVGAETVAEAGLHEAVIVGADGALVRKFRLQAGRKYCLAAVEVPAGTRLILQDVTGKAGGDLSKACAIVLERWTR